MRPIQFPMPCPVCDEEIHGVGGLTEHLYYHGVLIYLPTQDGVNIVINDAYWKCACGHCFDGMSTSESFRRGLLTHLNAHGGPVAHLAPYIVLQALANQ